MIATLGINDRRPIVQDSTPGPKTLFVQAVPNWPAAAGEAIPSIPLDVKIEGLVTRGTVIDEFSIDLPNLGLLREIVCDTLTVSAFYSPIQGLATPYAQYQISGSVSRGFTGRTGGSFCSKFTAPGFTPSTALMPIPPYAREVRVTTPSDVQLIMYCLKRDAVAWIAAIPGRRLDRWNLIHPLAYYYVVNVTNVSPYVYENCVNVEWR